MFNSESKFDAQLPGLVVKHSVLLPKNELRLELKSDDDIKLIKLCEQYKNYVLLLAPSFNTEKNIMISGSLHVLF